MWWKIRPIIRQVFFWLPFFECFLCTVGRLKWIPNILEKKNSIWCFSLAVFFLGSELSSWEDTVQHKSPLPVNLFGDLRCLHLSWISSGFDVFSCFYLVKYVCTLLWTPTLDPLEWLISTFREYFLYKWLVNKHTSNAAVDQLFSRRLNCPQTNRGIKGRPLYLFMFMTSLNTTARGVFHSVFFTSALIFF